eukprot:8456159-Pyramimonas_sp.AAC.1
MLCATRPTSARRATLVPDYRLLLQITKRPNIVVSFGVCNVAARFGLALIVGFVFVGFVREI